MGMFYATQAHEVCASVRDAHIYIYIYIYIYRLPLYTPTYPSHFRRSPCTAPPYALPRAPLCPA